jgi:hypothetical protein
VSQSASWALAHSRAELNQLSHSGKLGTEIPNAATIPTKTSREIIGRSPRSIVFMSVKEQSVPRGAAS